LNDYLWSIKNKLKNLNSAQYTCMPIKLNPLSLHDICYDNLWSFSSNTNFSPEHYFVTNINLVSFRIIFLVPLLIWSKINDLLIYFPHQSLKIFNAFFFTFLWENLPKILRANQTRGSEIPWHRKRYFMAYPLKSLKPSRAERGKTFYFSYNFRASPQCSFIQALSWSPQVK